MTATFDPITGFDAALEKIASYMWPPGPGYTPEQIEALRHIRPIPKPKPAVRGTRYNGEAEE